MTERAELGSSLPEYVPEIGTPQAVEKSASTSREITNSNLRLLRIVTPLALAFSALVIACGGNRGEDQYETSTGILHVEPDCTLLPPASTPDTATPYYEYCPLGITLEASDGETFLLEGDVFPNFTESPEEDLREFRESNNNRFARVTGTEELRTIQVSSFELIPALNIVDLRKAATDVQVENYPCIALKPPLDDESPESWNAQFSWVIEGDQVQFTRILTETTDRQDPDPSTITIVVDGQGELIDVSSQPSNICPQ